MSLQVTSQTTGVGRTAPAALRFFGHGAEFALDLPQAARVTVSVYDVAGRKVTSFGSRACDAGSYRYALRGVAPRVSGVYFARAEIATASGVVTRTARTLLVQ